MYLSVYQEDVSTTHFSTTMTTSILTSATLTLRGYHLYVVLIGFYSSYNLCAIMMLQLWWDVSSLDSIFDLFSSLTIYGTPAVTAGDVRVYLVVYILCIIDCHICRDIFGRIILCIVYYHMYLELSCPSRLLYSIYRSRGTIQYDQQLYVIYYCYKRYLKLS
jgi:hypothetical protein